MHITVSGVSRAFLDYPPVEAAPGDGPLNGLRLAVKDLFDVQGYPTGGGSPTWLADHPTPAASHAPAVAALLNAGAVFKGKTITDELAYALNGENVHYGTPVNAAAPSRVPGGSSSGSAAAVASGEVEIGLGSDTGGSIRLPGSYCGLFGLRPTHGRISLDGVMKLAPSFDTVGWMTRDATTLRKVGQVLLGLGRGRQWRPIMHREAVAEAPEAWAALRPALLKVLERVGPVTSAAVTGGAGLDAWRDCFRYCQGAEIWSTHGAWVTRARPAFGPGIRDRFAWAATITPDQETTARAMRAAINDRVPDLLGEDGLLLLPTAPGAAPPLGLDGPAQEATRRASLSLLCTAGLCGLPQVTLPLGRFDDAPLGLSMIGPRGSDEDLLLLAEEIAA